MAYKTKIAGITIKLDGDTSDLVKKLDGVSKQVGNIGKSLENVGKDLTTKVSVPIVTGIGAAVKTAADFDEQMSKVQAISGANADEFNALRDKAREMGEQTKFSATESGEAFEYMAMAGWKTEDMLSGINGIMSLAAASGEDLGTTSDIVTDALTAFGMSANDAGRFSDILAAAATNANTNVSMMGQSFKYVAPVAGSLGYSAEDVAVALGLMANSGIKADMAGTSLRNMFQRMAKPTTESAMAMQRLGVAMYDDEGNMYSFREIMDQLRVSFSDINMSAEDYDAALDKLDQALEDGTITQKKYDKELEELNKQAFGAEGAEKARAAAMLGGTRAMSGLLAIANATEEDYTSLQKAIDGSSDSFAQLADGSVVPLNEALESGQEIIAQYNGQAEAMAAIMQNNLSGDLTMLKSQLQELAISFGELLMPLLREVVDKIRGIVDWLNSLSDEQKEQILKIAAIVAAVGPVLLIIGKVITAVSTVISIISTITTVLSVAGAAIGAAALPILGIVAAIAAVIAIGVAVYKNWDTIKEKAEQVWTVIKITFEGIKEKIIEVFTKVKEAVSNAWSNIKETVSSTMDGIKQKILDSPIAKAVSTVWNNAKERMGEALGNMKQAYEDHGGGLKGAVAATMQGIKEYYKAGFDFLNTLTGGKLGEIVSKVKDKMSSMLTSVKDTFGKIKDAIQNAVNFIKDLFSGNIDFPHFNLPHFTIDGGQLPWGIGGKGYPPEISVSWYKKAMEKGILLDGATIFGAMNGNLLGGGESGSELIIGMNKLMDMISKAKGGDMIINNQFTINADDRTPQELAQEISYYINIEVQKMQGAFA